MSGAPCRLRFIGISSRATQINTSYGVLLNKHFSSYYSSPSISLLDKRTNLHKHHTFSTTSRKSNKCREFRRIHKSVGTAKDAKNGHDNEASIHEGGRSDTGTKGLLDDTGGPNQQATASPIAHDVGQTSMSLRVYHLGNQVIDSLTRIAQKINIYTGTDYANIQKLRESIQDLEGSLRSHHENVTSTKVAHKAALSTQRTHQKEVVQLLERKHSWSDSDMERYMGLIRSEHANERAVETAQHEVVAAERSLEEARQELERKERKMYHEEQIWSDTIRRNSTWVTFGLMGFNVILLLTQIIAVEPWRRERLVREMRTAIGEQNVVKTAASAEPLVQPTMETLSNEGVRPNEHSSIEVESQHTSEENSTSATVDYEEEVQAYLEQDFRHRVSLSDEAFKHLPKHPFSSLEAFTRRENWIALFERVRIILHDLISDRPILLRRQELTSARLETAVLGLMLGGLSILVGFLVADDG